MLLFYKLSVGLFFWLCFPFLLLFVLITGKHRRGLSERLGLISIKQNPPSNGCRIWIQAASIGEVKAAGILINHLREKNSQCDFVVSTMTIHGRDYARESLPGLVSCVLAPLDVPIIVSRVVRQINPDVYVCLETELWPLVIHTVEQAGCRALLLNGRISDKSTRSYHRLRPLFKPVLNCFDAIGAIGAIDRKRFISIGAEPERVFVTGNIKHDVTHNAEQLSVSKSFRKLLSLVEDETVFVAGSTHDPEEELLLPLYSRFNQQHNQVWLVAPRHLERIAAIRAMLDSKDIGYDLFSDCRKGHKRTHSLVLVDTFGDLAQLYSIADYVFIGGSFSDHGGHNLMEPAIWNKVVFYGPHIQDFQEAAAALEKAGGGICVSSPAGLGDKLEWFRENRTEYHRACQRAGEIARSQQGAAKTQTDLVLRFMGRRE